jgi:SAM-dependent methyltransferase
MSFAISAAAYDRFMGRYSEPLAPLFADFAGVDAGGAVLDVGCGTGALTAELGRRLGAERVAAVDPAPQFVELCRARVPGADVREGAVEELPFDDASFDAALAQLVFAFVADADRAVAQMRRVVRSGGTVAGCMWAAGEMEMLRAFWEAAAAGGGPTGGSPDARMRYRTREELEDLLRRNGLEGIEIERLAVETTYDGFDELWSGFQTAAGPTASFYASLDDEARLRVRAALSATLGDPSGAFTMRAVAWAVRGRVPDRASG